MLLPSCGSTAPPTTAQRESEAIAAAKSVDSGEKLKNGESKQVLTAYGPVIVSKDQSGTVSYKKK